MSGGATLRPAGEGRFELSGRLDFETVPAVLAASKPLFEGLDSVTVDLSGVEQSNSAGLGLLLEWMRLAGGRREVHYLHIPEGVRAVARASDLDSLLPV